MTTNHSSGRRHRGRRGRRADNRKPEQQQPAQHPAAEEIVEQPEAPTVTVQEAPPETVAQSQPSPPPRRPATAGNRGRADAHGQRSSRRRPQPRQTLGPMPTEVLKRGLTLEAPRHERQTRTVESMIDGPNPNLGCPMLSRIQTRLPATGFQHAPRCALAWSLHDEDEALLCMYTGSLLDCWQAHPEKVEGLRAMIAEDESGATAAD